VNSLAMTEYDLSAASASLEGATSSEIVQWAVDQFGDGLCLTSSMSDAVLIDVALKVEPSIEVIFLDTQYHFPETLETLVAVRDKYQANLKVMRPDFPLDDLWALDTDTCCDRRKVRQLDAALVGKTAWLSGLRRADTEARADTPIVSRDRRGLVKVNPIANWSDADVETYIALHDVPVNPLLSQGYLSIGCWPCTSKVGDGDDARSGRWAGTNKTECGLHL
jgi:phosphoadenosine phosphosulfate reductase